MAFSKLQLCSNGFTWISKVMAALPDQTTPIYSLATQNPKEPELSGMRWLQTGAENLLRLRAVAENEDWDAYYAYRRQQRQLRLYGQPVSNMQALESQSINSQPVLQAFVSNGHAKYAQLPLVV